MLRITSSFDIAILYSETFRARLSIPWPEVTRTAWGHYSACNLKIQCQKNGYGVPL